MTAEKPSAAANVAAHKYVDDITCNDAECRSCGGYHIGTASLAEAFDNFAAEAVKDALGMAIPNVVGAEGRKQQILEEIRARGKTNG